MKNHMERTRNFLTRRLSAKRGNMVLFVAGSVVVLGLAYGSLMFWLPQLKGSNAKRNTKAQVQTVLEAAVAYGTYLLVNRVCADTTTWMAAAQNTDASAGPLTAEDGCPTSYQEYYADSASQVNFGRMVVPYPTADHPTEGVIVRSGNPNAVLRNVTANFDVNALALLDGHPLQDVARSLIGGQITALTVEWNRVSNIHLNGENMDMYFDIKASLAANYAAKVVGLGVATLTKRIGLHPAIIGNRTLTAAGNILHNQNTPQGPRDFVISKTNTNNFPANGGLRFYGPVVVNGKLNDAHAGIVLRPNRSQGFPSTYVNTAYLGPVTINSGALQEEVATGSGTAGGIRNLEVAGDLANRMWAQANFRGVKFSKGLTFAPGRGDADFGLRQIAGEAPGSNIDGNRVTFCREVGDSVFDPRATAGGDVVVREINAASQSISEIEHDLRIGLTKKNRFTQQIRTVSTVHASEPNLSNSAKLIDSINLDVTSPSNPVAEIRLRLIDNGGNDNGHFARVTLGRNGDKVTFTMKARDVTAEKNAYLNAEAEVQRIQDLINGLDRDQLRDNYRDARQALLDNYAAERPLRDRIEDSSIFPAVNFGPGGRVNSRDSKRTSRDNLIGNLPTIPYHDQSGALAAINAEKAVDNKESDRNDDQFFIDSHNSTNYDELSETASEWGDINQITQNRLTLRTARNTARSAYKAAIDLENDLSVAQADRDTKQAAWEAVEPFEGVQSRIEVAINNFVSFGKAQRHFVDVKIKAIDGFAFKDNAVPEILIRPFGVGFNGSGGNLRSGSQNLDEYNVRYRFRMQTNPDRELLAANNIPNSLRPLASAQGLPVNGGNPLNNQGPLNELPNEAEDFEESVASCLNEELASPNVSNLNMFRDQSEIAAHFAPVVPGSSARGNIEWNGNNAVMTDPSVPATAARAVGGPNWIIPVVSLAANCVVKSSANFIVGFYNCINFVIESRTRPLTIIGPIMAIRGFIHPRAIKAGINWYAINHLDAITIMRNQLVLYGGAAGSCDRMNEPSFRGWSPEPSLNKAALLYRCGPKRLLAASDPHSTWTSYVAQCGRDPNDPNNPNTICMRIPDRFNVSTLAYELEL